MNDKSVATLTIWTDEGPAVFVFEELSMDIKEGLVVSDTGEIYDPNKNVSFHGKGRWLDLETFEREDD